MVAWHGLSAQAQAAAPPKAEVPLKAVLTLTANQYAILPDGGPPDSATYSEFTTMNSGEKLGGWWTSQKTMTPYTDLETGETRVDGPGSITFTRVKQ